MILSGALLKLEAVLAGAVSANQPEATVDYTDWNAQGQETPPATVRSALNSNTDVTILAAPQTVNVGNPVREPIRVAIYNKDTASVTVTVKTDDGTTERIIIKATLLTLESLHWDKANGWYSLDASGNIKQISGVVNITNASSVTVKDANFTLQDDGDVTKQGQFQLSGITAGNTRILTWPDGAGTIARTSDVPAAAAQSDQETGTSTTTYVSPGRQQYHPSAAKGWCQATVTGIATTSYNVTSVTDTGTGNALITWDIDMSSGNYCAIATQKNAGLTYMEVVSDSNFAAGTTRVLSIDTAGGVQDPTNHMIAVFGDQ